jgi:hypothetical protein
MIAEGLGGAIDAGEGDLGERACGGHELSLGADAARMPSRSIRTSRFDSSLNENPER